MMLSRQLQHRIVLPSSITYDMMQDEPVTVSSNQKQLDSNNRRGVVRRNAPEIGVMISFMWSGRHLLLVKTRIRMHGHHGHGFG